MPDKNTSPIIQKTTIEESQYEFDDSNNVSYVEKKYRENRNVDPYELYP